MAVCGIYKITNKETNECYIGQSIDVYGRLKQHSSNKYDKNDWHQCFQKYPELYTFEILTRCNPEDLNDEEAYYIYKYNSVNDGYNKTKGNHSVFIQKKSEQKEIITQEKISKTNLDINDDPDNTNILLTLNSLFFLENTQQLNSNDLDLLVYYIYANVKKIKPYPAHYLKLVKKVNKGSGRWYDIIHDANNKLLKMGLIQNDKPIDEIIEGKYTIKINFQKFINLKTKPSKYTLTFLCLIENLKKSNKNVISLKKLLFNYQRTVDSIRYIIKPTIELLNKYYYTKPVAYQIIKKGNINDKIIFNWNE